MDEVSFAHSRVAYHADFHLHDLLLLRLHLLINLSPTKRVILLLFRWLFSGGLFGVGCAASGGHWESG